MTEIIILVVTVGLIAYDIYAAANKKDGDTITQVILKWSTKYPVVPFVFGFLMGHFFGDF